MKLDYFVSEVNRGHFIVRLKDGSFADSSCVDDQIEPARFTETEANRVAQLFHIDSNGFSSLWRAVVAHGASLE